MGCFSVTAGGPVSEGELLRRPEVQRQRETESSSKRFLKHSQRGEQCRVRWASGGEELDMAGEWQVVS